MKKQHKRVRDFVRSEAGLWQAQLGLMHWEIEHRFLDTFYGDDGEDDFKVTAVCEVRWNYMQAIIKWYLPSAMRHSKATLRGTLVHELCHVLLAAEQSVVDTLSDMGTAEAEAAANVAWEKLELSTELCSRALLMATGYEASGAEGCARGSR